MDKITKVTRLEAYGTRPVTRQGAILEILGDRELTARQIAGEMGFVDLNAVRPRLTELMAAGEIETVRKQRDPITGKNVAVFCKRKDPAATGSDPNDSKTIQLTLSAL